MLWVTRRNSRVKSPTVKRSRGRTGTRRLRDVDAVLGQLRLDQRERHRRAVDRPGELLHDVGHGADVVFVAVRQHERSRPGRALEEVREVRDDEVDAEQFGLREHRAGVDRDEGVGIGDGHRIQAELAEAPQRDDFEEGLVGRRIRLLHGHRCPRAPHPAPAGRGDDDTGLSWVPDPAPGTTTRFVTGRRFDEAVRWAHSPITPPGRAPGGCAGPIGACQAAGRALATGVIPPVIPRELYHSRRDSGIEDVRKPCQFFKMQCLRAPRRIDRRRPEHIGGLRASRGGGRLKRVREHLAPLGEHGPDQRLETAPVS